MTANATVDEATPARPGIRPRFAVAIVVAWVVVQLVVPVFVGRGDRIRPVAWQMFAASTEAPTFEIEYVDGDVETIDLEDVTPMARAEVDYPGLLPGHLCETVDDAAAVHVDDRRVPC